MAHVLLVNDTPGSIAEPVRRALRASHHVAVAQSVADCLARVTATPPDAILLDLQHPGRGGFDAFDAIRSVDTRVPVIFLAPAAAAGVVIEAIKRGASDCVFKPLDLVQLQKALDEALDAAGRVHEPDTRPDPGTDDGGTGPIIGSCPAMMEVYKAVGRVAPQDVPVLITGESGTGKELVARAVHQYSRRAGRPFVALNCAAIPEQLLESELFGHEKGAFTGADRRRIGRFEQCDGGTLFLDEIGDMPLALQSKLLRVLQEQAFERVGGGETVRTDVRIISATHRDLKARAAAGTFRPDLYYRLGVFTMRLPPLRDRAEDLPLLVRHFLGRFNRELGRRVSDISAEALARLTQYAWPGNLRELQSVLKQALLRTTGTVLLPSALADMAGPSAAPASEPPARADLHQFVRRRLSDGSENLLEEARLELDRFLLPMVMELTRGNQVRAARVLGVARLTLRRRLHELGIAPRFVDSAVS
ncbi:Nitrogen assimilation regulatory protein [Gemmata obscuriglobus]|uniref:DNA-binding transcriptional regulator NtrC n=1 Tax=Gemmata obscuriglobus TaxID=114 RepID=A0A2Z3GX97_9BACT|nr:sigma-54 dependent transcriptional regulator [Gemmata obscuriglobus]AWM36036.1 sigma-54-dependent Fis family transcriptional regulator [Gemmata obscuriglobus]QEG31389.1 Nitrogen assimilation regulatory protein [Gemmata obscuriglobus]VTS10729.1 response regulator with -like aaa-type and dna-binding domains : Response regulator with CheY-like receiver, AAA-type ATPase, and DNA-binding domains OS=Singulisphaera acidiphila (strain ATCC BAA-1392 / DSM 18658 / VKM B-2454 / MOB10) GN=Sinac_7189 PE=4